MKSEQWSEVERLFHDAAERPASERDAWLELACADAVVRREVQSLLAQHASTPGALDSHGLRQFTGSVAAETLVGQRIGGYEFLSLIDEGGMGQVYRARDLSLPRDIAIKVLSPEFAHDPVRRARFRQEAEVLASFAHPHIAHIYAFVEADDRPLLAMELVSGETLAAAIERGPLPIETVLSYGAEIADALVEAHARGVAHRDLKPANVMVTDRGVKVLDFGLATSETIAAAGPVPPAGTPAYMAPEQAAGRMVGPRADLFSLGLVLYEMATGHLPLPGRSLGRLLVIDPATSIPPASQAQRAIPARLDALIANLLAVDPIERPRDAVAVRDELRAMLAVLGRGRRGSWLFVAAVAIATSLVVWWTVRSPVSGYEVVQVTPILVSPGEKRDPVLSPDGRWLAFSWAGVAGNAPGLYVAAVSGGEPRRLTETPTRDTAPAWSPDGRRVAFQRLHPGMPNELYVVPAAGGPPRKVRDVEAFTNFTITQTWTPDGRSVILSMLDRDTHHTSLFRIGVDDDSVRRVAKARAEAIGQPSLSADGQWLAEVDNFDLRVQHVGPDGTVDGTPRVVTHAESLWTPALSPDGQELFFVDQTQRRIAGWNASTGSLQAAYSAPFIPGEVTANWSSARAPLVVFSWGGGQLELRTLDLGADGRHPTTAQLVLRAAYAGAYSPNGRWIAFSRFENGLDLWLADASGKHARRLTHESASTIREPMWSPDGRHIAFHMRKGSVAQIYVLDIDPAAEMAKPDEAPSTFVPRQVVHTDFNLVSPQWSTDGRVLYVLRNETQRLMRVAAGGGLLEDLFPSNSARVHPSGERIYYVRRTRELFTRSLVGDVRSNPEELVLSDGYARGGFDVTREGIYYVATSERGVPSAMRFYEFATRRSVDIGPPPSANFFPSLRVAPNGRQLLFDTIQDPPAGLMLLRLRRR